eukprot:5046937-Pyramimonas_sp.AAC.1
METRGPVGIEHIRAAVEDMFAEPHMQLLRATDAPDCKIRGIRLPVHRCQVGLDADVKSLFTLIHRVA